MSTDKSRFPALLVQELMTSVTNWYGADNWAPERFGRYRTPLRSWFIVTINKLLREKVSVVPNLKRAIRSVSDTEYSIEEFSSLYDQLEDKYSKDLLVKLAVYRIIGYRKVKLPLNTEFYSSQRKLAESLAKNGNTSRIDSFNWKLKKFELNKIGYLIELYSIPDAVLQMFILKQYEYKKRTPQIKVQNGDYVIDAGGCWGDSALYFAHEVGKQGKVFTFEFLPENLKVLRQNLTLNPPLEKRIVVIPNALWSLSDERIGYSAAGPGTSLTKEADASAYVSTLSIDDFVKQQKLPRVDYIKMDIEGAELKALEGARETIRTFRPKLAIALYHKTEDFVTIPNYLDQLNVGYEFFLDHFTIHQEETVLFANPKAS